MIRRGFGTNSSVFRSLAVAIAALASIGGGSLLLQAGALGRPAPARLELVRTLGVLGGYRRSNAVIQVGTHSHITSCRDHWGTRFRRADVMFDGRHLVAEINRHLDRHGVFVLTVFELAGCPRALTEQLVRQLQNGNRVELRRISVDGLLTWELEVRGVRPAIELFVSPRTGLPITLALAGRQIHGTSDLSFGARR